MSSSRASPAPPIDPRPSRRQVSDHARDRSPAPQRLAMMLMTLGAWLVAFVVVLALLSALGDELESLPLALRALVISGVLVFLMVNLVMPALNVAIARWLTRAPSGGAMVSRDAARGSRERSMSAKGGT
jgi:hypothetical protein